MDLTEPVSRRTRPRFRDRHGWNPLAVFAQGIRSALADAALLVGAIAIGSLPLSLYLLSGGKFPQNLAELFVSLPLIWILTAASLPGLALLVVGGFLAIAFFHDEQRRLERWLLLVVTSLAFHVCWLSLSSRYPLALSSVVLAVALACVVTPPLLRRVLERRMAQDSAGEEFSWEDVDGDAIDEHAVEAPEDRERSEGTSPPSPDLRAEED